MKRELREALKLEQENTHQHQIQKSKAQDILLALGVVSLITIAGILTRKVIQKKRNSNKDF